MAHHTVLHVIETGGPGGAETVFRDLVTGLPSTRWRSIAAVPVKDWLYEALKDRGLSPVLLSAQGNGTGKTLLRLRKMIHAEGVDLVHAHLLGAGVYATLAPFPGHIPVVCTLHGLPDVSESQRFLALKLRLIWTGGNRVVFVSRALRDAVLSRHPLPRGQVSVVHNGVEVDRPALTGFEREELGATPNDFLVAAVGNLRPAKDYPTLLRAVAILRDRGCAVRGAILGQGGGRLEQELLELRSRLQLEGRVSFLGFRTDALRLLSACDAFVLSSSTEGFSLSTVEALGLGVPVVATACGGPEEIIRDGATGLLVPPGNPGKLASALMRLSEEPGLGRELASRGLRHVQERFSKARMIGGYEAIYDAQIRAAGR